MSFVAFIVRDATSQRKWHNKGHATGVLLIAQYHAYKLISLLSSDFTFGSAPARCCFFLPSSAVPSVSLILSFVTKGLHAPCMLSFASNVANNFCKISLIQITKGRKRNCIFTSIDVISCSAIGVVIGWLFSSLALIFVIFMNFIKVHFNVDFEPRMLVSNLKYCEM